MRAFANIRPAPAAETARRYAKLGAPPPPPPDPEEELPLPLDDDDEPLELELEPLELEELLLEDEELEELLLELAAEVVTEIATDCAERLPAAS